MDRAALDRFAADVSEGLSATPKRLSSKYFYDERGDALFVKIMNSSEYYLTDCEFEIFSQQTEALIQAFGIGDGYFELYELGAGDGTKTMELLKGLQSKNFTYRPIDISTNAIDQLEKRVHKELPNIQVKGMQGEYFQVLDALTSEHPKVVLFMGSNIGNMEDEQAHDFLQRLSDSLQPGDRLLLGVDLKKSTDIVLPAYNDEQGYTREFNLNLLDRINRELGGHFDRDAFTHAPEYNEEEGWARSFLKSEQDQEVRIDYLDQSFSFGKDERIDMEISRKYDDEILKRLIEGTSLHLTDKLYDGRKYFCDVILERQ